VEDYLESTPIAGLVAAADGLAVRPKAPTKRTRPATTFSRALGQMVNLRAVTGLIAAASLAACASLDVSATYQPPSQKPIPSSATVDKPFDQAWDGFIRQISQSFFVVNNLSKNSKSDSGRTNSAAKRE